MIILIRRLDFYQNVRFRYTYHSWRAMPDVRAGSGFEIKYAK
jgi:hypothetical protein